MVDRLLAVRKLQLMRAPARFGEIKETKPDKSGLNAVEVDAPLFHAGIAGPNRSASRGRGMFRGRRDANLPGLRGRGRGAGPPQRRPGAVPLSDVGFRCRRCHCMHHLAKDCTLIDPQNPHSFALTKESIARSISVTCSNCNGPNHYASGCTKPTGIEPQKFLAENRVTVNQAEVGNFLANYLPAILMLLQPSMALMDMILTVGFKMTRARRTKRASGMMRMLRSQSRKHASSLKTYFRGVDMILLQQSMRMATRY